MLDAIMNRRSYRGKYKNMPIPRADLTAIMEAGLAAPSGCNMQTTSLIAVDDPEVLGRIKDVIDPKFGETAPAAIFVLTQRINAYRNANYSVQDYSAAIENILLAVTELGYASCWVEGHITDDDRICDKIAQILNVPKDYDLVTFLPIGFPETSATSPSKRPFEERAWFNSFPGANGKSK
jgi:nitroreductase